MESLFSAAVPFCLPLCCFKSCNKFLFWDSDPLIRSVRLDQTGSDQTLILCDVGPVLIFLHPTWTYQVAQW